MNPDDLEAYADPNGAVTAEIDSEGVIHIPLVPRHSLIVIEVELLERMMTHVYGEGRSAEAAWAKRQTP